MIHTVDQHITGQENKVRLTIDCSPLDAELILSLCAPLAYDEEYIYRSMVAMPEALMQLAIRINRLEYDSLSEHWSPLTRRVVKNFLDSMSDFLFTMNFNYLDWQEKFLDDLSAFQTKVASEEDDQLFEIIRAVVIQISEKNFNEEQRKVYCVGLGTPLTFEEWVERLIEPDRLSEFDIEHAHFRMLHARRLRELVMKWTRLDPDKSEIPF